MIKPNRKDVYEEWITSAKTKTITLESAFAEGYNRGFHNAERIYNKTNK